MKASRVVVMVYQDDGQVDTVEVSATEEGVPREAHIGGMPDVFVKDQIRTLKAALRLLNPYKGRLDYEVLKRTQYYSEDFPNAV